MSASPDAGPTDLPWTQSDLGEALELSALQTLYELDPRNGVQFLREYLAMFHASLEPALVKMRQCRESHDLTGLAFEAHKLQSAVAHIGARRLSVACRALTAAASKPADLQEQGRLDVLMEDVVAQTTEVQQVLARLVQA